MLYNTVLFRWKKWKNEYSSDNQTDDALEPISTRPRYAPANHACVHTDTIRYF